MEVSDIKKDVQCSLCNDTLIEPKIMPCFHTFCKLCVKRHAELIDEVNVFKCPKCKSEIRLPELSSVEDLKPSVLHSRIVKRLALVEGRNVCSVSESHSPASLYCFDCDRSMCDECEKSHSLFMKDHKVVSFSAMKKEDIELIVKGENRCKSHGKRLALFCEECNTAICLACLKQDHTGHKLFKLDTFASMKREVLAKQLEVLNKLRIDEKYKKEQEDVASTIKQDEERAKKEVKEMTRKIIETMQENERELLRQIEMKFEKASKNLNIIHHVPAVEEYINNVMERGLASEMMNIQETECSEDFIFSPLPQYSRIVFVANEELLSTRLGEIQSYSKTDPTMSSIVVDHWFRQLEVLKREKLKVILKNSIGELSVNPTDVVDVKIGPKDDVVTKKKSAIADGQIEVEFMAKVIGQLTAEVQVNGNHVSNSPLVMKIMPQEIKTRRFRIKGVYPKSHFNAIAVNTENSMIAVTVTEVSAHCVHVFNTKGELLRRYGSQGRGCRQFSFPSGLAFRNETDLVISDSGNHRICVINATAGKLIKAFGKQGTEDGEFCAPSGIHVDNDGNIIVCDNGNQRVQVFSSDGDFKYKFSIKKKHGHKFSPVDVVTHGGRFYVSDSNNRVIHVFEKKYGVPTRISTIGDGEDTQITPCGMAIDNNHYLIVCDQENRQIRKFALDGSLVGTTAGSIIRKPLYAAVLNDGKFLITSHCGILTEF